MSAPLVKPRRFPWWVYWTLFVLIGLFSFAPLVVTVIAAAIAQSNDCQISEGLRTPCVIDGVDYGADLQAFGNMFWLLLLTWPIGIVLTVIWGIVLLLHHRFWRKRAVAGT